jgi:hypothetical protein
LNAAQFLKQTKNKTNNIFTMKKIIFFLSFMFALAINSEAQNTVPRYGITPNADNTGRVLTYAFAAVTDKAGKDSITIAANAFQTNYIATVTDSVAYLGNVTNCYAGDHITFCFIKGSGTGTALFLGGNWKVSTASVRLSLTASKRTTIDFIFDGTYWLETGRSTQAN